MIDLVSLEETMEDFLSVRDLRKPDGRPLYSYQATSQELSELHRLAGMDQQVRLEAVVPPVVLGPAGALRVVPWRGDLIVLDAGLSEVSRTTLAGPLRRADHPGKDIRRRSAADGLVAPGWPGRPA